MKTIWLTGSNGFIGKHLVGELHDNNYNLKCFSNSPNLNAKKLNNNSCNYMDFSSGIDIEKQIDSHGCPDIFIHLGWGDMASPMSGLHLTDNVKEAKTLIDTLYLAGLKKFIFIGSMNEYGARIGSLAEDMAPSGRLTNYAEAKIEVAEFGFKRAIDYHKIFVHIRPFYVFGSGQKQGSLINELFCARLEKRDAKLGPCEHFRDYIHVFDVVKGIRLLTEINESTTVNLGRGAFIKVKDFVILLWTYFGCDLKRLHFGSLSMSKDEPEQPPSYANLNRLKRLTNWKPSYSIEGGVQSTVECLLQSSNNGEMANND